MKRLLSLALVLGCITLVSACGKKTTDTPSDIGSSLSSIAPLESLETIEAKAKAGNVNAQFELGAMYHDGQGVAKDFPKAKEWFEKAAAQNDPRAQFNLGVMYYTGESVKKDYKKAQEWFEKAAEQGNTRAQFNLGVMHYRAEGVKQNFETAMNYFTKSGSMGFAEAQFNLGVMLAKGEGAPVDVAQAYAWFETARSFGNPNASTVITQIEAELKPDEIKELKKLAEDLKKEVNARVSAAVAAGKMF